MFDEKNVSEENRKKLWGHYNDKLSKGVDEGFSDLEFDDSEIVKSLKKDVAKFSAFKETSFKNDLEKLLIKDDRLVPWSEFKKEAYKLSGDYNGTWLETEYHHTVANANMAQKWKEFERDVDLYPNLKLVSVNDGRVRPEHKALDGTIRPFNDPFWNTHTPPLDWGCRCDIEQTDEDPTEIPGGFQTKIEFENNPGKTGTIFGGSAYETNLSKADKNEAVKNAEKWEQEAEFKEVYERPRNQQFVTIIQNKKGKISQHSLVNKGEDYESILEIAKQFLADGSKNIELMPELNSQSLTSYRAKVFPKYKLLKNPDLRIDEEYFDVKRIENVKNFQRNANRAYNQDAIAVLEYNGDDLTQEKMQQQAKRIFGKNNVNSDGEHQYKKDVLYFSHKGKLYKYNRE